MTTAEVSERVNIPVISSGGIRTGLDAAKAIALGADIVGIGLPLFRASFQGKEKLLNWLKEFIHELKVATFLSGCNELKELQKVSIHVSDQTREWFESRDIETKNNHNFFANDMLVHNSLYLSIYKWLRNNGVSDEKWNSLTQEEKIDYTSRVSKEVENYVNKKSFEEVQRKCYNSNTDDFPVTFEQEKIAYSGLFVAKKRYATWTLLDEGDWKNDISVTGIEIVRSETPTLFRESIKDILSVILKGGEDSDIKKKIDEVKKAIRNVEHDKKDEEVIDDLIEWLKEKRI